MRATTNAPAVADRDRPQLGGADGQEAVHPQSSVKRARGTAPFRRRGLLRGGAPREQPEIVEGRADAFGLGRVEIE